MITIYLFFVNLMRRIRIGMKDPEFRGLFYTAVIIVALGGVFYHKIEGWSWLDSYYFTIITLTTVGYGDFAPQTSLGKIFTMLYVVLGLGIISSFILLLARQTEDAPPLFHRLLGHNKNKAANATTDTAVSTPEDNQP
jgi:voltage-gated potassium channel Kch